MKIDQIEQILAIARTGSINKAAKMLYISQPNLSTSLKSIETELNIQIFMRSKHGMTLTPVGQELLYYAEPIYQQFLSVPEMFSHIANSEKTILSLSNAYMKFVSNVLMETINGHLGAKYFVKYRECTTDEVLDNVQSQISDLGVVYFSSIQRNRMNKLFRYKKLKYTKLMDDELKIIFGKNNPMFEQELEFVTNEMLASYPIVIYETTLSSELIETIRLELNNVPRIITVDSRGSLLDIIRNTAAVTIGTNSSVPYRRTPFYHDVKTLPLKQSSFSMEVGWVSRAEYVPNDAAAYFIDRLTDITKE